MTTTDDLNKLALHCYSVGRLDGGMGTAEVEVFGAGRPAAAHAAIVHLELLLNTVSQCGGWVPDGIATELAEARRVRAMYAEYGDAAAAFDRMTRA